MEAIHTKITLSDMPITTEDVLYTTIGDKYNYIRSKIEIADDISDQEMFDANTGLEIYMKRELHELGECASVITSDAVKYMGSLNFIKNFRIIQQLEEL